MTPTAAPRVHVGAVTATRLEAATLRRCPGVSVRACGVAGAGIERAVAELAALGCGLIVSWGTAGALSPRLRAGDLVVPEYVVARDGARLATDPRARGEFRRRVDGVWPAESNIVVESGAVLAAPGDKRRLGAEKNADAVDMESGRIGEACAPLDLSFLVVRAIVDELGDRLPRTLRDSISSDGSLRVGALVAGLLPHPGDWAALVTLARRYRRARVALDKAARGLAAVAAGGP